jgi:non-canonical (house-cleaning) NTP pyrophosphatase
VKAVENAFKDMYGSGVQIDCNGVKDVKSFVSDQPVSDFETQTGALNRARNARAMLAAANDKADFYVGVRQVVLLCERAQSFTRVAGGGRILPDAGTGRACS